MKVFLIAAESPVRKRLAGAMAEPAGIHVDVRDPGDFAEGWTIGPPLPDVVLVDIDDSKGRGLEIIRHIHELGDGRAPVIMAIASASSLQYRESCREAGAVYFFDREREQDWLLESLASLRGQLG